MVTNTKLLHSYHVRTSTIFLNTNRTFRTRFGMCRYIRLRGWVIGLPLLQQYAGDRSMYFFITFVAKLIPTTAQDECLCGVITIDNIIASGRLAPMQVFLTLWTKCWKKKKLNAKKKSLSSHQFFMLPWRNCCKLSDCILPGHLYPIPAS